MKDASNAEAGDSPEVVPGEAVGRPGVRRYGSVLAVRRDKVDAYTQLHAHAWPGVLRRITDCNIRNYSIYLRELEPGKYYLFSYFEYVGDDFDADMSKMAADEETQRWWRQIDPWIEPIATKRSGEKWSAMEEVFHLE